MWIQRNEGIYWTCWSRGTTSRVYPQLQWNEQMSRWCSSSRTNSERVFLDYKVHRCLYVHKWLWCWTYDITFKESGFCSRTFTSHFPWTFDASRWESDNFHGKHDEDRILDNWQRQWKVHRSSELSRLHASFVHRQVSQGIGRRTSLTWFASVSYSLLGLHLE